MSEAEEALPPRSGLALLRVASSSDDDASVARCWSESAEKRFCSSASSWEGDERSYARGAHRVSIRG